MKKNWILKYMSFWPPYLGSGIQVKNVSPDFTSIDVEMKLKFWNKNYVGTQFGGSLYSMTDPFYMLMLLENLGPQYIVWDKAANIRFKKPGRGRVRARFRLSAAQVAEIKNQLKTERKIEPVFKVDIQDESGEVIAEVEKTLYIRKKD